ncbi:aquaporin 12 [Scleropages formosus]|uniref:aquaporin 12 n=1 Tax=Scleropages formosus TaxID=113540 RepID=UPI0010FA8B7B|nr:aquaporin-12-like [Scleropages formosus]
MSALNVSLGFLVGVTTLTLSAGSILRLRPLWSFSAEFPASFMLVACWLEVRTLAELGPWAAGFGPDVAATALFLVLLAHGVVSRGASGNPLVIFGQFLQRETTAPRALSALVGHFSAACLAQLVARFYWSLELSDMHLIRNLMARECTPALRGSMLQGAFAEGVCALLFHLMHLRLQQSSALLRVPLVALLLTVLSCAASSHTAGFTNPSLAYALTFHCPGFTWAQYCAVYWLAPLVATVTALFLYTGHIPRLFTRNLLYPQKSRFRVPRAKQQQDRTDKRGETRAEKKGA